MIRWAPDGTKDLEIEIPAPNVTSVAFAGPDLRTLVIGTARENLTEEQLEDYEPQTTSGAALKERLEAATSREDETDGSRRVLR